MVVLDVKNLGFQLRQKYILKNISFCLKASQLLQVFGANGSGKTTLLKILAGLIKADEGQLNWHTGQAQKKELGLAYLGHKNGLKRDLSVAEQIALYQSLFGCLGKKDAINKHLNAFGIANSTKKFIRALSFGQQRKVALALLFTNSAEIWLLDEPFVGLDESSVEYAMSVIKQHCIAGKSIIMSSHAKYQFDDLNCAELTI